MFAYLWMCLSTLMMALMGVMAHQLGRTGSCPWQVVALMRMSCMLVVIIPIMYAQGITFPWRASWNLWGRTLAGNCGVFCTFFALAHIPVADATTLFNTAPIWIVIFTWLVRGDPPQWKICLAILCSMVGVVIVLQPHFATDSVHTKIAVFTAAMTAVCMAVAFMNLNSLKNVPSLAIVAHFSFWGSVILLIFCVSTCGLTREAFPCNFYPHGLLLIGVGLAGAAGQIALTKAYKNGAPSKVAVVGLSQVVFAAVMERIFWNRMFSGTEIIGFLMILVPVAAIILYRSGTRGRDMENVG